MIMLKIRSLFTAILTDIASYSLELQFATLDHCLSLLCGFVVQNKLKLV